MSSRGSFWSDEATLSLLSIWKEHRIQEQMDGTVRNSTVLRKIADLLHKQGIERSVAQVKGKMKKLRESFRKAEDNNRLSGRGRQSCRYYSELSEILAGRPETNPVAVVASVSLASSLDPPVADNSLTDDDDLGCTSDDGQDQDVPEQDVRNGDTPAELVGDFVDDVDDDLDVSLETGNNVRANKQGSKKGGTKRKKSKLQQSMETMAKHMKSLEEDSATRQERVEDRHRREQVEWERELLRNRQEMEERRREEDRQFRARERELDRQHQLQMVQAIAGAFQNRPPWPTEAPFHGNPEGHRLAHDPGHTSKQWPDQSFPRSYTSL